jgi:hypothetical protein
VRAGLLRPASQPAQRLATVLERLGTTFVKLGQGLSLHRELLPDDYVAALARLHDRVEPFACEQVRAALDLGIVAGPLDRPAFRASMDELIREYARKAGRELRPRLGEQRGAAPGGDAAARTDRLCGRAGTHLAPGAGLPDAGGTAGLKRSVQARTRTPRTAGKGRVRGTVTRAT